MGPYDVALKHILRAGGRAFLGRLGVSGRIRRLDTELPSVKERRVDFLGAVGRNRLVHVEFQATRDEAMSLRMLGYYSEILQGRLEGRGAGSLRTLQVRQIVIFVGSGTWAPAPIRHANLWFQFETVSASDIDAASLVETGDVGDAVLGILCRGGTSQAMIRSILQRIMDAPETARGDALAQLFVLSGLRRAVKRVEKEYASMGITVNVENIPFLRAPIDQAFERGEAEGEARGEARGHSRGKAAMFASLLIKKFGAAVPPGLVETLETLPTAVIDAMGDRFAASASLEEVLGSDWPKDAV